MTEREKLLKILDTHIAPRERLNPLEAVADYLLDSGVVVLPCEVGETIYAPLGSEVVQGNVGSISIINSEIGRFKLQIYLSNGACLFLTEKDIGKIIYFTREEAEKALKESINNDKA